MPVPILLVTGFLGAGKTTLVNHVLGNAGGRRIAAVMNDFGAINIDAELIAGASDGVVSLTNGCICCSLEGDLLRTLASILRRTPKPDAIIIETSGVADPADIVRNLMDPVIWRDAPLETVLCVADATAPDGLDDALLRSQVCAADIIALSKLDLATCHEPDTVRPAVHAINPRALVIEAVQGAVSLELLFPPVPGSRPVARDPGRPRPVADRFTAVSWTTDQPISLQRLQAVINRLAPKLARAKGFFESVEQPGRSLLLQFAGGRATLAAVGAPPSGIPRVRMVFISEIGALSEAEISQAMEGCLLR